MRILILITSVLIFSGCASRDINSSIPPSTRHAIAAEAAGRRNHWDAARSHWANAVTCAEREERAPTTLAEMYFEYGRSLAVLGEFTAAETYLLKALEIDKKTYGNFDAVLTELARINLDQKKHKEALAYYDELLLSLMKIKLDSAKPESFLTILTEYSTCLSALGRDQDASTVDSLIKRFQSENYYATPSQKRIPYGNRIVSFPIPSHKFVTPEPAPEEPVDFNIYIAKKQPSPRHPFWDHLTTQIMIQIILHQ